MSRTTTTMIGIVLFAFSCGSVARAAIVPGDIQAWYGLNGDVQDNSANGFHGVNNGATFVNDAVRGDVGSFDGTASSVDVGGSGFSITERPNFEFSTSFWIKPTVRDDVVPGGGVDTNVIMGAPGSGVIELGGQGAWGSMGGVVGSIGVNSGGGAGSAAKVPAIDVYDGDWHHVLIQWVDTDGTAAGGDSNDATVYVDGVLADDVNGATYNGNSGQANPSMVLGGPVVGSNGGAANDYYRGLMSDVIFFNRQLTADEVPEAMALSAGSPIPEPSTLVLAAVGLLSLGLGARRRRRRA